MGVAIVVKRKNNDAEVRPIPVLKFLVVSFDLHAAKIIFTCHGACL